MPTITEPQLIAAGFTRVAGTGQRLQHWTGAVAGECVEVAWDSVSGRKWRMTGRDSIPIAALFACVRFIVEQNFTLTPGQRTALVQALSDAFKED